MAGTANPVIQCGSVEALIAALPLALVGVDDSGQIVAANEEAEILLRYRRAELIGRSVDMLLPEPMRGRHVQHRAAYRRAPLDRRMAATQDLTALAGDGSPLSVRVSLKAVETPQGVVTLAGIVDMTAERMLEHRLREQHQDMERRVAERTADLEVRNREMVALLASLESARSELEQLSRIDPLTGLTNRREFDTAAESELRRAQRRKGPTCVAMLDLDHFKEVNDRFGHRIGDAVLRRVAEILKAHCRADDLLARYGGDEFVLLLPETDLVPAYHVVERMRRNVEEDDWNRLQPDVAVTISAGVALHDPGRSIQSTIDRADQKLYESKASGRNTVLPRSQETS